MHALDTEKVYSLEDLVSWPGEGVSLAVLGHPVKHSLSPAMHNAALAHMAEREPSFRDWRYYKFDVTPESLPEALPNFAAAGFVGLNLTVPHKVVALPLVASADPEATRMGAVNTLKRTEAGWIGANTDGYGLENALREELDARLPGATVVLLGAGGAARAAAVRCLDRGCARLWLGNRSSERLQELVRQLEKAGLGERLRTFLLAEPPAVPADAILINATSVGLHEDDASPLDLRGYREPLRVFDMIYRPPRTALLRQAQEQGWPNANGLAMLVHQGVRSLEIWSEADVPVQAMQQAAEQASSQS